MCVWPVCMKFKRVTLYVTRSIKWIIVMHLNCAFAKVFLPSSIVVRYTNYFQHFNLIHIGQWNGFSTLYHQINYHFKFAKVFFPLIWVQWTKTWSAWIVDVCDSAGKKPKSHQLSRWWDSFYLTGARAPSNNTSHLYCFKKTLTEMIRFCDMPCHLAYRVLSVCAPNIKYCAIEWWQLNVYS